MMTVLCLITSKKGEVMSKLYSPEWFSEEIERTKKEIDKWPESIRAIKPAAVFFLRMEDVK